MNPDSVNPDQTGAVCSGSTLFASILNLSVMLGNYLQQTTSVDDNFRCFFLALKGLKPCFVLAIPSPIGTVTTNDKSECVIKLFFFFATRTVSMYLL